MRCINGRMLWPWAATAIQAVPDFARNEAQSAFSALLCVILQSHMTFLYDQQICVFHCLPLIVQSLIVLHLFSWFLRVSKMYRRHLVIAMRHVSKEEQAPKRTDLAVKLYNDQNSARDVEATTRRMRGYKRWTLCNQKVMYGGRMETLPEPAWVSYWLSLLP